VREVISMTHRKSHWDRVHTTKAADEVSWFQPAPVNSLRLIDAAGVHPAT
jgi:hypothetical protein